MDDGHSFTQPEVRPAVTFVRWPQIRSPGLGFPTGDILELNAREVKTGVESKVYILRLRPELQLVQSSVDSYFSAPVH